MTDLEHRLALGDGRRAENIQHDPVEGGLDFLFELAEVIRDKPSFCPWTTVSLILTVGVNRPVLPELRTSYLSIQTGLATMSGLPGAMPRYCMTLWMG